MSDDENYHLYPVYTMAQYEASKNRKSCTCGILLVMGPDYPLDRHSDWCDMYVPAPKEVITDGTGD